MRTVWVWSSWTHCRRIWQRGQSPQRTGREGREKAGGSETAASQTGGSASGGGEVRGQNTALTRRGWMVFAPFSWQHSRRGHGRQEARRPAYSTRSDPFRSCLRSCAYRVWPVGQRNVPSGWRAKSAPANPFVYEGRAHCGGPYDAKASPDGWGASAEQDVSSGGGSSPAEDRAADRVAEHVGAISSGGGSSPSGDSLTCE